MKVSYGVCVYCRHERGILLARSKTLNRWEALSGKIRRGETPLAAASRVVETHTKMQPVFPSIHQVVGAPSGLLLYTEYAAGPDELRLGFIFMAKIDTDNILPQDKQYGSFKWLDNARNLPRPLMPYVEGTIPLAFMAVSLDGIPGGR